MFEFPSIRAKQAHHFAAFPAFAAAHCSTTKGINSNFLITEFSFIVVSNSFDEKSKRFP